MIPASASPAQRTHPGILLRQRFLDPLGISAAQLAKAIGLRRERVAGLLAGQGRLTPDLALRLGLFFGVPTRWWLDLQSDYDATDSEYEESLRAVVRPWPERHRFFFTPIGVQPLPEPMATGAPLTVALDPALVARLRAQVALNPERPAREPVIVYLEDGRPMLTGRPG